MTQPHPVSSAGGATALRGALPDGKRHEFLTTKVMAPRCPGLMERPRLINLSSQLSEKRLAVIKAPAGFGKTSLAATWFEQLRQSGNAVAWLTIDPDDDEPATFLFYVSHALQRACKGMSTAAIELIRESFLINPRAIISTLMNQLADVEDEVYLFLEDYQWIANPKIHEAMAYFLRRAPSHCHVVLTTRTEPPLPLASLRAQNQLLEIDTSALRFDLQETQNFIEIEKPGALAPSDVRLLHQKTQGWPAALRIVGSMPVQMGQDFGKYVRNLSGTRSSVGAYLEEVLDGLPREMLQFMLRTAILDRLCASLCEAVTGTSSSRELLESIAKRQLLLASLDHEDQWYRYHPLLGEYLFQRLESELGNEIPGLHRRASLWYASQELWTDAVQHAIAGGDAVRALDWIKKCAMPLVKRGDLFTLLGWQRLFPNALMRDQPEVRLAIAWGMALAVRYEESLELVSEIERDVENNDSADDVRRECAAIRSVAIALKDDSEAALSIAEAVLDRSVDPWTANVTSNVVRFGYLKRGDLKKFHATPWIPYSIEEDRRNVFAAVYYRCIQGMAEAQELRIAAAECHYLDALHLAEQHVGPNSVAAALPASLFARIRYDQGRLDEAEAMLIDRLPLVSAGAMLDCVLSAYFVLARIAVHRMNLERANTLLEWAENQGNTRGWGRLSAAAVLERTRLCLSEGRIDKASGCLERLERLARDYPAPTNCAWSDIQRYAAFARAYIASAEERFDEAIAILDPLRRELKGVQNLRLALRVETQLASVRFRAEQSADALRSFGNIVTVLAQAGIYQPILDEGTEIGPLLMAFQETAKRAVNFRELTPYLANLIAAWRSRYESEPRLTSSSATAELLSARESTILKLIAKGLSNKEIARDLTIAPETVKTHVKRIFAKLNVERRAQAVSRAQSLGLASTQ
ncbi:LuxR family transcriptional regulator, maltose regulon positive regulatory protein [Rhizobiales bacterium GAS113]|nr:LuxR family transcriptional regulator, maltose regulon positive regulatory protein [Rhizobiales bacterium GAS113]